MESTPVQLTHQEFKRQQLKFPLCILANDIEVPMNIGSIFRIADAQGVEKIFLTGSSAVPPNKKIKKTARSTERAVPYEYQKNATDVVNDLKEAGYIIISLEITSSSKDIRTFADRNIDKMCLIIGAENTGVHQDLLNLSDYCVHIPMFGQNSSMNDATACAIAVFEFAKKYMPF